jgi:peroxiredoxin Q/BCP
MARTPEVGEAAPDFTRPGVALAGGQAVRGEYALSAMRGTPVVLAFYPGDDTFVGTRQLCSYTAGVVRWRHVALVGLTFPSPAAITAQVAELTSAG